MASASGVQSPGQEVYRLCSWACYRIKFLDRYRGLTCVLFNMWQMAALNLELFHRCRLRQLTPMFQATWAVSRPSGPWLCAGQLACYRLARRAPDGRVGAVQPTGQLCGLAQEKQSWYKVGCTTKCSTRLSVTYISCTHTDTHIHTLRVEQWA